MSAEKNELLRTVAALAQEIRRTDSRLTALRTERDATMYRAKLAQATWAELQDAALMGTPVTVGRALERGRAAASGS